MLEKFSASLRIGDLNDFITPSHGCVVSMKSSSVRLGDKPKSLKHNPKSRFLTEGKEEYQANIFSLAVYGGSLLAIFSNDFTCFYDCSECIWIQRIDVNVKNLDSVDSGDLTAISSESSMYVLKYNHDVVASAHLDSETPVDDQGVGRFLSTSI